MCRCPTGLFVTEVTEGSTIVHLSRSKNASYASYVCIYIYVYIFVYMYARFGSGRGSALNPNESATVPYDLCCLAPAVKRSARFETVRLKGNGGGIETMNERCGTN